MISRTILVVLCATLCACAGAPAAKPTAPETSATTRPADAPAELRALFASSDEDSLRRNPLSALFRGDLRYADQLGDIFTDAHNDAEREAAMRELARLHAIDRAQLDATDRIAYDVFEYEQEQSLIDLRPDMLELTEVRPLNHFYGIHVFYPVISSGKGAAPFKTATDYDNALLRHAQYADLIDRAIGRFREGMASGIVETRLTINNVIAQLDTQLAAPVDESTYFGPVGDFPAEFTDADRERYTQRYRDAIRLQIYPALTRLRDFLRDEYLPKTREVVGLAAMPRGTELYARLIEARTTLPLTAAEVHELGLTEVARIREQMMKVREAVGFEGTLPQFFEFIRNDPQFKPSSRESLTEAYYALGRRVDQQIGRFFTDLPKAALEIRPYEPFREKFQAGGSYQRGTPDGSRPGIFYFNAYDLPSRTSPGMTSLYLHEGAPGHHFQISLAQENTALPNFMRFGGNTAYVEGWALYVETLGYEMGLYDDPYQRFGHLDSEMLRAMRLVVDTGLHTKGWTREQAIRYMLDNSSMGETDATAEVERYIAIPGQALAYKIGALTIQRLRRKAEKELGSKFDLREFHRQVLNTGALPLPILERKIDTWIAAMRQPQAS
ncbi:MAG: DUF885 domain-containing protein [Steroidobacteraceae bacterium]